MGNPNHPSFEALNKTLESLKEIRSALIPFIQLLKDDDELNSRTKKKRGDDSSKVNNEQITPHKRAEAQAAVALAIGAAAPLAAVAAWRHGAHAQEPQCQPPAAGAGAGADRTTAKPSRHFVGRQRKKMRVSTYSLWRWSP